MSRAVASTLLLLLWAPLVLPAVPTSAGAVPVCCRANGAHHCMASLQSTDAHPAVGGQQLCPHRHSAVLPSAAARPKFDSAIFSGAEAHPFLQEFVPGIHPSERTDSHAGRAPPLASR
jgi:hypothetical protein